MKCLIIGMGEVGKAHYENLVKKYYVYRKDISDDVLDINGMPIHNLNPDILLIATRCDPNNITVFENMVCDYAKQFNPKHIDILTTTPCGTTERIQDRLTGLTVCRSSTRGMHPNLAKFLIDIPKHIGGPGKEALAAFYEAAGWTCVLHEKAALVEFSHKWNNITYGANIMITDECADDARREGIDFIEYLKYRESNNSGFIKAGFPSKVSPILYPSNHHVGGHCVVYSATTIPEEHRGPITKLLAGYNNASKN